MKRRIFSLLLVVSILLVPVSGTLAQVDIDHPEVATPIFAGELPEQGSSSGSEILPLFAATEPGFVVASMQAGGDRLVALQQNDGGWDWPLDDGDPNNASPLNTLGPIAMGLLQSHWHTADPDFVTALQNAGALLLTKTNNFSPSDGYLAAALDGLLGGTTYVDHVTANFYAPLAAGTYDRNGAGTLYDTAGYVDLIRTSRANGGIGNLAAWDVAMGLVGAAAAGADTTAWIDGTKAEIDELDGAEYYDVIGLAGAVYGLAYVGEDFDPTTGEHAAAGNIGDLADILVSYQINQGGFAWNSNYVIPNDSNETIQETAYAVLALNEVDRAAYLSSIVGAADYMAAVQLSTGGWENYPGSGENNEITGEALWGMHVVLPELWVDQVNGNDANDGSYENPMQTVPAALAAAVEGTTIHLLAGTYTGGLVLNKEALIVRGTDGAIVGAGSPAFTITAPDVLIEGLVIDGTGDLDSSPGILVQAGGDNLMVRDCEIANWVDGIEVAASVTSLKVVSNWIHSNADAGLQINSGVTVGGITTIEGNLFKANTGNGIQNDSGNSLMAEYNSWGDIGGPATGDGISGPDVDADPFTYAEFFMDMEPDTLATSVSIGNGETFDIAIKADAVNLYGLSFRFTYDPAVLTLNSTIFSSPWASSCSPVGTPPVGEVYYRCNLAAVTAWSATAASGSTDGTIATFNFTESDPSSSTAAWPSYIDIDPIESTAGAIGGVKVFLNNAGYNDPSVPDRDITDTDDGQINLDLANYTGFVDLQGRTDDSGATLNVYNQSTILGAINLAAGTTSAGGGYTTANIAPYQLVLNTTYYLLVDAPLYLPTTELYSGSTTDYAHSYLLNTQPLTTLNTLVLLGGDATDNDLIDISDATCIGGSYQSTSTCSGGPGADADVNADGVIDILDLTLMGGNYGLDNSSWTP